MHVQACPPAVLREDVSFIVESLRSHGASGWAGVTGGGGKGLALSMFWGQNG